MSDLNDLAELTPKPAREAFWPQAERSWSWPSAELDRPGLLSRRVHDFSAIGMPSSLISRDRTGGTFSRFAEASVLRRGLRDLLERGCATVPDGDNAGDDTVPAMEDKFIAMIPLQGFLVSDLPALMTLLDPMLKPSLRKLSPWPTEPTP